LPAYLNGRQNIIFAGEIRMKRIYVIEDLCNGCRLCQTFCSSLKTGVFNPDDPETGIRVLKMPGEEQDIPLVQCTGALIYGNLEWARSRRMELAAARGTHGLFKVLAPWKWPFPWAKFKKDSGNV
jgi:ferredoxin